MWRSEDAVWLWSDSFEVEGGKRQSELQVPNLIRDHGEPVPLLSRMLGTVWSGVITCKSDQSTSCGKSYDPNIRERRQ